MEDVMMHHTLHSVSMDSANESHDSHDLWIAELSKNAPRRVAHRIVFSWWVRCFSTVVILCNFVLLCMDADNRARSERNPLWLDASMLVCFVTYILELFLVFFVRRLAVFRDPAACLDFVVVGIGLLEYLLPVFDVDVDGVGILRIVRLCRLLRLVRAVRILRHMPELGKLLTLFTSSFKTLFWSSLLCGLVMTIWAVVAVESLDSVVRKMAEDDADLWVECPRCQRAFASVMDANLTFLQAVVAGDSWGTIAMPVIEAHPWTAIVFVGSLMTLVYGVLNLIVAVIVDTFTDIRSKDIDLIARDLRQEETDDKKLLHHIFRAMDRDKNGSVSLPEIYFAARHMQKFRNFLRILHLGGTDAGEIFGLLDENGDGQVQEEEFVRTMLAMKRDQQNPAQLRRPSRAVSPGRLSQSQLRAEEYQNDIKVQVEDLKSKMISVTQKLDSRVRHSAVGKTISMVSASMSQPRSRDVSPPSPGPSRRVSKVIVSAPSNASSDCMFASATVDSHIQQMFSEREMEISNLLRGSLAQAASMALDAGVAKARVVLRSMAFAEYEAGASVGSGMMDLQKDVWQRDMSTASSMSHMSNGSPAPGIYSAGPSRYTSDESRLWSRGSRNRRKRRSPIRQVVGFGPTLFKAAPASPPLCNSRSGELPEAPDTGLVGAESGETAVRSAASLTETALQSDTLAADAGRLRI